MNTNTMVFLGACGVLAFLLLKDHLAFLFNFVSTNVAKIKLPTKATPTPPPEEPKLVAKVREFNEFKSTLAGTPAEAALEEVFPLLLQSTETVDKVIVAVKQFNILKKTIAGTTAEAKLDEVFPLLLAQEPKSNG